MTDWKDDYREYKDESGKTWEEFIATEMYHESELDDLRSEVERLTDRVDALVEIVRELKNHIGEVLILARGAEK